MNAEAAMQAELRRLRRLRPEVTGSLLSGVDGLLIASDLTGVDADHVAALAGAGAGLGERFARTIGHGRLQECVVRGSHGCVVTYPAAREALLTVVTLPEVDLTGLHAEARRMAERLGEFVEALWPSSSPLLTPAADPLAPLATRTPMATLPTGLWTS